MQTNSARLIELQPNNGYGFDYLGVAEGNSLTQAEKDAVSALVYSRFYFRDGLPVWRDDMASKVREIITKQVNEVLDALAMCNIRLTPNEGDNRG